MVGAARWRAAASGDRARRGIVPERRVSGGYRGGRGTAERVGDSRVTSSARAASMADVRNLPRNVQRRRTAPDIGGKARAAIGALRTLGDAPERAQLGEAVVPVEAADLVHVAGQIAGEKQAVVERS